MNQELLDHIDSTLRNKTLPVKKKSKADIVMQKMFDDESTLMEDQRQLSRANRIRRPISGGPQEMKALKEMNETEEAHDTFLDSLKDTRGG
jgi:hypothetical protein